MLGLLNIILLPNSWMQKSLLLSTCSIFWLAGPISSTNHTVSSWWWQHCNSTQTDAGCSPQNCVIWNWSGAFNQWDLENWNPLLCWLSMVGPHFDLGNVNLKCFVWFANHGSHPAMWFFSPLSFSTDVTTPKNALRVQERSIVRSTRNLRHAKVI